jgi:predicted RNase H-like HicB family nuclease
MNMAIMPTSLNFKGVNHRGILLEEVLANIKEAIELYLETLSEEEIRESLSRASLTTAVEVQVA